MYESKIAGLSEQLKTNQSRITALEKDLSILKKQVRFLYGRIASLTPLKSEIRLDSLGLPQGIPQSSELIATCEPPPPSVWGSLFLRNPTSRSDTVVYLYLTQVGEDLPEDVGALLNCQISPNKTTQIYITGLPFRFTDLQRISGFVITSSGERIDLPSIQAPAPTYSVPVPAISSATLDSGYSGTFTITCINAGNVGVIEFKNLGVGEVRLLEISLSPPPYVGWPEKYAFKATNTSITFATTCGRATSGATNTVYIGGRPSDIPAGAIVFAEALFSNGSRIPFRIIVT